MAFKNRRIGKDERREYNVEYFDELAYRGTKSESFSSGTVDDENNIWLLTFGQLGDPMDNEEWEGFIFDYNGEIFYLYLRYELGEGDTITWYDLESDRPLDDKQMQSLRDAFRVYKRNGTSLTSCIEFNERYETIIRF